MKKDVKNAAAAFFDTMTEQMEVQPDPVAENDAAVPATEPGRPEPVELVIPANGGVVKLEGGFYRLPKAADTVETKTKRVQLVFQPSLYKAAKAEAKRRGTSLNDLVHIALRAYLGTEDKQ